MKVARTDVKKNLPKKGFRKDKSKGHIYFYHEYRGKETGVSTYVSHSSSFKDISGDILKCMRKQLRLDTNREVVELVNCPMSKEDYNTRMRQKGIF